MLHITALMDNKSTEHKALIAEHGLSLYLEHDGRRMLFDCGSGTNHLKNAHRLGVDLRKLDAVVISHSHYDHAAGFRDLTQAGLGSSVLYTGTGFFEPKYAFEGVRYTNLSAGFDREFLAEHHIEHREITEMQEIFPGVYLISHFPRVHDFESIPDRFVRRNKSGFVEDDFSDEICMAVRVKGGIAVLVGCSHPGILNMITHVRNLLRQPVKAVFGGTHLVEADEERIDTTINALKSMGLEILGLSHCSGDIAEHAASGFADIEGCHLGVGDCVFFE